MVRNANDPASLRLGIELHAGVGGMTGAVRDERGGCHPFSGWLGLISALDALVRAHADGELTQDVIAMQGGTP